MESDEDPLLVKFLISSLEFEKLKYYESKCHELSAELEKFKLNNAEQADGGKYVVGPNVIDSLETPALSEVTDTGKPLINYGVVITKNDDNESALLDLVPEKEQFIAKFLLHKIDERASELTWNSSGVVFIDKFSIPNSNFFVIYPYLFRKFMPKKVIPGLKEVLQKLQVMGLDQYTVLKLSEKIMN